MSGNGFNVRKRSNTQDQYCIRLYRTGTNDNDSGKRLILFFGTDDSTYRGSISTTKVRVVFSVTARLLTTESKKTLLTCHQLRVDAAIKALRPVNYNYTYAPGTKTAGFLAHELQEVVPTAVEGEKDGTVEIGTLYDWDRSSQS